MGRPDAYSNPLLMLLALSFQAEMGSNNVSEYTTVTLLESQSTLIKVAAHPMEMDKDINNDP